MNRWQLLCGAAPFESLFFAIFIVFAGSSKRARAAEERAHARRMAEHRMNARLLRLDI